MDMHNGDSLRSGCLTSVDCRLHILPLGFEDHMAICWTPFVEASWRSQLFRENPARDVDCCASWREAPVGMWQLGFLFRGSEMALGCLGLGQCSCRG
jgi:hypothetical protein